MEETGLNRIAKTARASAKLPLRAVAAELRRGTAHAAGGGRVAATRAGAKPARPRDAPRAGLGSAR